MANVDYRRFHVKDSSSDAAKMMRYAFDNGGCILDTETSGLGATARICDIAIIDMEGNELLNTLLNPGKPIPSEASEINHITDDMVKDKPLFKDIAESLLSVLETHQPVMIYNKSYDWPLIEEHFRMDCADRPELLERFRRIKAECAMRACGACNSGKIIALTKMADKWGVHIENAHRAIGDVQMTRKVMEKVLAAEEDQLTLF